MSIKVIMKVLAILSALMVLPSVELLEVTVKPADTVALNGSDVLLTCTVEESGDADILEWNEYVTLPTGNRIWWSFEPDNIIIRPETFEIVGMYDLRIKSIRLEDGGRYGCRLLSQNELYPAEVSVYEKSICNAMGEDLREYDMAYISCHVPYGGSHEPEVEFYDTVTWEKLTVNTERGPNYVYISANITVMAETDGKLYECRVKQDAPLYEDMCTTSFNVSYSVRNVTLSPDRGDFYSGEEITCTAQGNPEPQIWWENMDGVEANGTSNHTINGTVLVITDEMEGGSNMWRCVAENTVSGNTTTAEQDISFIVYPGERTTPVISLASGYNGYYHVLTLSSCLLAWLCTEMRRPRLI